MVYNVKYFDYNLLHFELLEKPEGNSSKKAYAKQIAAFDIETTRLVEYEQSIMYVWQVAIDDIVVIGRTWNEYIEFLLNVKKRLNGLQLVVFDHNLSFEFEYLAGIYHFNNYEVFATEPRNILRCNMYKAFEFRCSYRLTQLSLDAFTHRYKVPHAKRSGADFDYSKRRFADTPLTNREKLYCVYDVLGLVEAIRAYMALTGDCLYTLPLTQTGMVRRELKHNMQPYTLKLRDISPDYPCYKLLVASFRGGDTHCNRFYAGEIVPNVSSVDISSSYPSQQCLKKFPMSKFIECKDLSVAHMLRLIYDLGRAVVMHVRLYGVKLKYPYEPCPYISIAKCVTHVDAVTGKKRSSIIYPDESQSEVFYTSAIPLGREHFRPGMCKDNGRILQAAVLEICITDIDWKIIDLQYTFSKIEILSMWRACYGKLPQGIIDTNIQFFKAKTELKGIKDQYLYYMYMKQLLNAIYGDSVRLPLKPSIAFNGFEYDEIEIPDPAKKLAEYYKNPYLVFQFGVYTTAHARHDLFCGREIVTPRQVLYCDTDSIKYIGSADFTEYNAEKIAECLEVGAYAKDKHGITHYMGVYEQELNDIGGTAYERFCTLGAKKYAYESIDEIRHKDKRTGETWTTTEKRLHITISGVNKKRGAEELAKHGGLERFAACRDSGEDDALSITFKDACKVEAIYNDKRAGILQADGRKVIVTPNVVLRDTTYKLHVDNDYSDTMLCADVQASAKLLKRMNEFCANCEL